MIWLERLVLGAFLVAVASGFALVAHSEYVGYCISDYTCTANITPRAFR